MNWNTLNSSLLSIYIFIILLISCEQPKETFPTYSNNFSTSKLNSWITPCNLFFAHKNRVLATNAFDFPESLIKIVNYQSMLSRNLLQVSKIKVNMPNNWQVCILLMIVNGRSAYNTEKFAQSKSPKPAS